MIVFLAVAWNAHCTSIARKIYFEISILASNFVILATTYCRAYLKMRADAMVHLKYLFRISSILERTKNSTKTKNTSFERSDSGLLKSWRLGAWHSYWPATPTLYDKLNFLGKGGMASPWCCHAPVLQEYFCPLSGLSNEILYVFVPFLLFQ